MRSVFMKTAKANSWRKCILCNEFYIFVCLNCIYNFKQKALSKEKSKKPLIPETIHSCINAIFNIKNNTSGIQSIIKQLRNTYHQIIEFLKNQLNHLCVQEENQPSQRQSESIYFQIYENTTISLNYYLEKVIFYKRLQNLFISDGNGKLNLEKLRHNFPTIEEYKMETFEEENEPSTSKDTPLISEVGSKSSLAGKIFSSWITKGKRKKVPEVPTIECNLSKKDSLESSQTDKSSDFVPVHEQKSLTFSSSTKSCSEIKEIQESSSKPNTSKYNYQDQETNAKHSKSILRKLISKKGTSPTTSYKNIPKENLSGHDMFHNAAQTMISMSEEMYVTQYSMEDSALKVDDHVKMPNTSKDADDSKHTPSGNVPIATSYINSPTTKIDIMLADGLREVTEFSTRLKDSEEHIMQILAKYIKNQSFQKELLETLSCYAKLHIEAERRAHKLANEMWLQQADMSRTQERALQDSLNTIVKQNRQLLEDNENLMRKNEKLSVKYDSYCHRGHLGCSNQIIENLNRSNDILRTKFSSCLYKMDEFEKELQNLQKRNSILEQNLRNSSAQLQNYKALLQRSSADYELGHAQLNHQLSLDQMLIKETTEAGDVLLDDLNSLKNQMKSMSFSINWTKFKARGKTLPDLIHICRSCINELSKELISTNSQNQLKDKDLEKLKADLEIYEEKINLMKYENSELLCQIDVLKVSQTQLEKFEENHALYEIERQEYQDKINELNNALESERCQLNMSTEEILKLNEKICAKETRLLEVQNKIGEYLNEINALELKINGLNQVLSESGSGDLSKKLTVMQEQLTAFQAEYFQVVSEKKSLENQIDLLKSEKQALGDYNNTYYEHMETLQKDLDLLSSNNIALKEELEKEKSTVQALQSERIRHLEEKNLLGAIYQQLNDDVSRVENLETKILQMNKEASRLSVIAEYNKQVSEQLQTEVAERDKTINELQKNMDKLSSLQVEHSKDKETLCYELKQICQIKEDLNHKLETEIQKCELNNEYKKELDTVREELKIMYEMQKTERSALKQLLQDFETVANQRNLLIVDRNNNLEEIKHLNTAIELGQENYIKLNEEYLKLKEKLQSSQNSILEKESKLMEYEKEVEAHCEGQMNEMENLKSTLSELRKENNILDNTTQYLKNNIQKLSSELNSSRESIVQIQKTLYNEQRDKEEISNQLLKERETLKTVSREKERLMEQIFILQKEHAKLTMEYDNLVKESAICQEENKTELLASKELLANTSEEINKLLNAVNQSKQIIDDLQMKKELLEKEKMNLEEKIKELSEANNEKFKLKEQMFEIEKQHSFCDDKIKSLLCEIDILKNQLSSTERDLEDHNEFYKNCVDEMEREYHSQRSIMKNDLQTLTTKILDLSNEITSKDKAFMQLEKSQKDLAAKLLNSVKICIDEKCAKQMAESKISDLTLEMSAAKTELRHLQEKVNIISNERDKLTDQLERISEEKCETTKQLIDLQSLNRNLATKLNNYEADVKELSQKCKQLSKIATEAKGEIEKSTVYKELQAKLNDYEMKIAILKNGIENNHDTVTGLQESLAKSKNDYAVLEFQKCEAVLRLHETMGKLTAEENLNFHLKQIHQRILSTILQLQESGDLDQKVYESLVPVIMNSQTTQ